MSDSLKKSPLEESHLQLGARLVPFAGWNMPVMYTSIMKEHAAVREKAGIFDISHMGQFFVRGEGASEWLEKMLTNRVAKLTNGQGQYTFLLNENGGVIDDLILYRIDETEYLLVVNAAKIDEDRAWLEQHQPNNAELIDESEGWAGMAIQGPESVSAFSKVYPDETLPERNGISKLADGSWVCRTGYTGEDGFELFCPSSDGNSVFQRFLNDGVEACGLGARDTLRLEMCYPLNGSDLSPERTPLQAGLGFFVDLTKGEFMGHNKLKEQKEQGIESRLVAIEYLDKGAPPRAHYPVISESGEELGELSSGALSPSLSKGIGMAYLPMTHTKIGTTLAIDVRGRRFPATVVKKPFYKHTSK